MATTPKIRYEIEAAAVGSADVRKLTGELEKLDDALSPQTAAAAARLVDELNSLGRQAGAIERFQELKTSSAAAAAALEQAQAAAQQMAAQLAAAGTPTRTQAGQLEKLKDAVRAAKTELQAQTAELDQASAGLTRLGIPLEGLVSKQAELRNAMRNTRQELEQLNTSAGGVNTYAKLAAATEDARLAVVRADAELEQFRSTLTDGATATRAQQLQLEALTAAARQSQSAFAAASQAQASATAAARAAGVDVDAITQSQQRARAATLATAEAARDAAIASQAQGRAAVAAGQQQAAAASTAREGLSQLAGQLQTIQQLAGAALGGQLLSGTLGDVSRTADAYANLAARVRLVTGEGEAFQQAFEGVFQVSQRTATSLENTGMLFANIARAGKDMGVSQQEALALTETINQAVQVSGASAASSDAALQQLLQALQSGVLRGEEFNSVMEQAPRLALALADGLGVTTGELRRQAEAGALSSQVVIKALQGQAQVIATEFGQLPPTVGRALTNLSTAWTQYVGEVDKANGISAAAAGAINALAGNLDTLGQVLFSAGKAAAAYAAINLAKTFVANAGAAAQSAAATAAETAAKAANTAALGSNTAATAANTAAKTANAAAAGSVGTAAAGAAGQVGRLATVLGTLRSLSLIGLVTNLGEIGTWIGESIAKWQGYGKAMEEAEAKARALEQAQREMAAADAAAAAARQRATEATMGLTGAAKELVGGYEAVIKSGGTTAEALAKVSQAGRLSDVTGIRTMSAALDSLTIAGELAGKRVAGVSAEISAALRAGGEDMEPRIQGALAQLERLGPTGVAAADALRASFGSALETGRLQEFGAVADSTLDSLRMRAAISGEQVRQSLADALRDEDLVKFEVNARAAFDGSEQGARRLSAALEAMDVEALRRAGINVTELKGGISAAAAGAINDFDAMTAAVGRLGAGTEQSQVQIAQALGKVLDKAKTQADIDAVADRFRLLGESGALSAQQVQDGIDLAGQKAQELAQKVEDATPGISGLGEAARKVGIDVNELLSGVSTAFADGLSDISRLAVEIDKAGVSADRAGPALARALDQQLAAAKTTEEAQALVRQIEDITARSPELGAALGGALEQARAKAAELTPEMQRTAAAAELLGIKLGEGAQKGTQSAIQAYETLKLSSKVTTEELQKAFLAMAEKVIEANGGIVPEWLKVEAGIRKVEGRLDAVVEKTKKAKDGAESMGKAGAQAGSQMAEGTSKANDELDKQLDLQERRIKQQERMNELAEREVALENKRRGVDANQMALDKTGKSTVSMEVPTLMSIMNTLKGYGLEEEEAMKIAREFTDGNGNVPYLNNPGQIKYGGYGGSMSFALQQAAEKALYPGGNLSNKIGGKPQNQAKTAAKSETSTTISPAPAPTPAPAPAPAPAARTVNVNLTLGGRSATIPTSESGADALLKILEQAQVSLGS